MKTMKPIAYDKETDNYNFYHRANRKNSSDIVITLNSDDFSPEQLQIV